VPTINVTNGQISVPAGTPAGTYAIVYQICEKLNPANCDFATATVNVNAPAIDAVADTIAGGNGTLGNANAGNVLSANPTDADTLNGTAVTIDQVNLTIVTAATSIGGAPVPTINVTNGQISVPAGTPAGTYAIVYQICEKLNPANCDFATATVNVNAPAAITLVASPTQIACFGGKGSVILSSNGTLPLTFGGDATTNLSAGTYHYTVTDANGATAAASATLIDGDTTAPVIGQLPNVATISCPATPVFDTASATDNIDSSVLLTYKDITTNGTCAGSYSVTRTWTATDACGNAATATQTINVIDATAPVIAALPATSTISCPATPAFADATATDDCGTAITLTSVDVTTNGTCAGTYSITRNWTAKDACGNTATASQTINVQDLTGPTTTTAFAPSIDVNCDAIPAKPELVFVDNCSTVATPVYTEKIINQTLTSYSIVREWNVADACGNSSKFNQTVNVTIANTGTVIQSSACNADSTPIDLNTLLPAGTPTNGTWINADNIGILQGSIFNPLDAPLGDHIFEYNVTDGSCPLSIKINMNVNFDCKVLGCEAVVLHNAFTPNGDGINEHLVIDGVNDDICYPSGVNVEIYNRWGVLVFETSKYDNETNAFEGYSKGRTTIKESAGLPAGTYYYILNYESFDGTGNIQINRKDGFIYLAR
jgi:gliding motility-associated-like protein